MPAPGQGLVRVGNLEAASPARAGGFTISQIKTTTRADSVSRCNGLAISVHRSLQKRFVRRQPPHAQAMPLAYHHDTATLVLHPKGVDKLLADALRQHLVAHV